VEGVEDVRVRDRLHRREAFDGRVERAVEKDRHLGIRRADRGDQAAVEAVEVGRRAPGRRTPCGVTALASVLEAEAALRMRLVERGVRNDRRMAA
jgi:hypothetical protein